MRAFIVQIEYKVINEDSQETLQSRNTAFPRYQMNNRWETINYTEHIMKIRLYNFDLLKPHFYIVKLGFTGVYIIFLILLKKTVDTR